MPQIIVIADSEGDGGEPPIVFRERVNVRDFESDHFAAQLVERLGWAVGDAHAAVEDAEPWPEAAASFSARRAQRVS